MNSNIIYAVTATFGMAGVLAVLLLIAARRFSVTENPLIEKLASAMPGVNCGACGMASCRAFAEKKAEDPEADIYCPVGGKDVAKKIAEILDIQMKESAPQVARLQCQGVTTVSAMATTYHGIEDCRAVSIVNGGDKLCPYGCIGFGSCIGACPFGAIKEKDGIVEIDENTCTGCGICIKVCPRHVLKLFPRGQKVYVGCNSNDRGGQVRTACAVGCIGCKKCEKTCEFDAIKVSDWKAMVNQEKCTKCGACIPACPVEAIVGVHMESKLKSLEAKKDKQEAGITS